MTSSSFSLFKWPFRERLKRLNSKPFWADSLKSILPCRDGVEHFVQAFQSEHKDHEPVWSAYDLDSATYVGTLVVVEEGDVVHVPLTPTPKPTLARQSFPQRRLYSLICERNRALTKDVQRALDLCKHSYLFVKIAIRHFRKLRVKPLKSYFRHGHANMLVIHCPSRHIFHLEPLDHPKSSDVLLTLERWLGQSIKPGGKQWILTSNLDFSTHLNLFPQKTPSLCRLWSWIMGLTLVWNGVTSTEAMVSVLQVFSHHTHVIFKFFMLFHFFVFSPSSCLNRCEEQDSLGKERQRVLGANLNVPPVRCPVIPVGHRETHYPHILRSVELDKPTSSLLLRLIQSYDS